MASPGSMPRRSPRGHKGSYPRHTDGVDGTSPLPNGYSAQALQALQGDSSHQLPEPSTPEIDREALAENAENAANLDDDYPPPPPPLFYNPENSNVSPQDLSSGKTSSTDVPATEPPSTYAATTQPPSINAGITQPPSTYAPSTQPPSTYAPSTQSPSTYAQTTQPPSTYAPTTQPPSTYAPTTQTPSTYAQTTQPPSTYAPTTQPPSTYAPTTQTPSTYAPATQPPPTYTSTPRRPLSSIPRPSQVSPPEATDRMNEPPVAEESVEVNAAEAEKKKDLHCLFVHLNRLTVNNQKAVASAFGVIQNGNKKTRAARLFVVISGMMERMRRTATELLEEKGMEKGRDFKSGFERTVRLWGEREESMVVPPIADLEAEGGVRQHPPPQREQAEPIIDDESDEEDTPEISPSGENVSLEEFARLMIIFRDVPEAAQDLRRSGQDLQRQDLDIHATRHAFWTDRIEELFNDPSLLTSHRLDGELQHIDAGRPVTTFRSGSCLQNLFKKFRKEFTLIYKRWDVSGNLDPSSFVNFCRLPHQKTLTRAGARCLIAFQVFRIGTAQENNLILDFGSKEMAADADAQLECGIASESQSAVGVKRRRSGSQSNMDEAIVHALTNFSKEGDSVNNVTKKRREEIQLDVLAVENARLEKERKMIDNLAEAHRLAGQMQPNLPPDNRVVGIIQSYFGRLADEMENHINARDS